MGSRKLKEWLLSPLRSQSKIYERYDHVRALIENREIARHLKEIIAEVYDIERIVSRVSYRRVSARDMVSLKKTLEAIPMVLLLISEFDCYTDLISILDPLDELKTLLVKGFVDEPSGNVGEGKTIKKGYDERLDECLELLRGSGEKLRELEEYERKRTGIQKLRIKKNNIYGYYIEISKANASKVPDDYVRRQTLVSCERYISDSLKPIEEKLNHATELVDQYEREAFWEIIEKVSKFIPALKEIAQGLSTLDVYLSISECSVENNYVEPDFNEHGEYCVKALRHPVVEKYEENFIPNDMMMNRESNFVILTGPNMSGKSTYLRQVALVSIMAQMGSYVPAKMAKLPLIDRVFTRIGARDDLASGKSTFLVEMSETATILNNATNESLIILDEVGRGTSTYDGISIAWVVSEYIYNSIGASCIFATHYNELTEMAGIYNGMRNMKVKVAEDNGEVIFLHKIEEGVADKSYGIEVARIAGLPTSVINRSYQVLESITSENRLDSKIRVLGVEQISEIKRKGKKKRNRVSKHQISFFAKES